MLAKELPNSGSPRTEGPGVIIRNRPERQKADAEPSRGGGPASVLRPQPPVSTNHPALGRPTVGLLYLCPGHGLLVMGGLRVLDELVPVTFRDRSQSIRIQGCVDSLINGVTSTCAWSHPFHYTWAAKKTKVRIFSENSQNRLQVNDSFESCDLGLNAPVAVPAKAAEQQAHAPFREIEATV